MCGLKKEEDRGDCSDTMNDMQQQEVVFQQEHQQQLILQQLQMMQQQQQQQNSDLLYGGGGGGVGEGLIFPPPPPPPQHQEVSPIFPWSLPPPVHSFNPSDFDSGRDGHDPFSLLPPPPAPYGRGAAGLFQYSRDPNSLQFAYEGGQPSSAAAADHHLRLISEALGGPAIHPGSSSSPFLGLHAELGKMTAQEIMDAKALAASKSHSEAERRRRERINNHLAKLRSLLPSTSKTDKASLLAEVIQHVKELKRQTSVIAESSPVPTETDELTVDMADDEDGKLVIKASLCCEDRSDLLPDLIKTLKALRLRTLKAEITTLGGRVRNVLFITADKGGGGEEDDDEEDEEEATADQQLHQCSISSIHDALKAVMEKTASDDQSTTSGSSVKRQRTNINIL